MIFVPSLTSISSLVFPLYLSGKNSQGLLAFVLIHSLSLSLSLSLSSARLREWAWASSALHFRENTSLDLSLTALGVSNLFWMASSPTKKKKSSSLGLEKVARIGLTVFFLKKFNPKEPRKKQSSLCSSLTY